MIETRPASSSVLAGAPTGGGWFFTTGWMARALAGRVALALGGVACCLGCGAAGAEPGAGDDGLRSGVLEEGVLQEGVERGGEPPLGQLSQPIVGGETDREHLAVVAITLIRRREVALCTGTLIAPNLVLTARHCVSATEGEEVDCNESEFGRLFSPEELWVSSSTTVGESTFYPVREVLVPDDGRALCGSDIALMIMDGQFRTTSIEPMAPRLNEPARRGEPFTAVGFGDALSDGEAGVRRALTGLEVVCGPEDCNSPNFLTRREFVGEQGVCDGDSGGPALDAAGRVVGVASRATVDCGLAVYTAITPWRDWILEVGERAFDQGRYDEPEWLAEPGALSSSEPLAAASAPEVNAASSDPGADLAPAQSARYEDPGCAIARGLGSEPHGPSGTRSAPLAALALAAVFAFRRRTGA